MTLTWSLLCRFILKHKEILCYKTVLKQHRRMTQDKNNATLCISVPVFFQYAKSIQGISHLFCTTALLSCLLLSAGCSDNLSSEKRHRREIILKLAIKKNPPNKSLASPEQWIVHFPLHHFLSADSLFLAKTHRLVAM